ncbi:MAG: response regulator, partial [Oxalobacteraceae bacterium]
MSKRIMLIEDEPLHRKLYTIWLQLDGHTVHAVSDERLAYVEAANVLPDVIIAD